MQAEFLGVHDQGKANYAIDSLNLDIKANLKTMSKGMKQKTAIVDAFMGDADVMLLDEPTTGLDPLMHKTFDELIKKEKGNGKTIIMSSHIFTEVEECCDIVYLLKNGSIIKTIEMEKIHHSPIKKYNIRFGNQTNYIAFLKLPLNFENHNDKTFEISVIVKNEDINTFINTLTNYDIIFFNEIKYTLSEQFLKAYNNEDKK
jgi:ABC-2 type transport system ATP-binding protein